MLVREAMSQPPVVVSPDVSLRAAAVLLCEHRISALPVVTDGVLVGVLSEADVVREQLLPDARPQLLPRQQPSAAAVSRVGDAMTSHPVTVGPADDLAVAVRLLTDTQVKSLPVVERGRVVGMVSRADVVRQVARRDSVVQAEIGELLRCDGVDWLVDVADGVATVEGPETPHERRLARALVNTVPGVAGVRVVRPAVPRWGTGTPPGAAARTSSASDRRSPSDRCTRGRGT